MEGNVIQFRKAQIKRHLNRCYDAMEALQEIADCPESNALSKLKANEMINQFKQLIAALVIKENEFGKRKS